MKGTHGENRGPQPGKTAFATPSRPQRSRLPVAWLGCAIATLVLGLALTSCASSKTSSSSNAPKKADKLTQELLSTPKETLFEKGRGLIGKKKYEEGRKYLNFIF
ncbi:MAG TPA: hypothetical protein VF376_00475, partial [Thermoanaerobaculia bacterium]